MGLLQQVEVPRTGNRLGPALHVQFAADVGLSGVIVAKLDSTAKGGFAFAVADDLGVPIKFIGTGEKIEHLVPFEPQQFVAALFAQN